MDILIGMDVITMGDFIISNFEGKTCFSFRIPSTQLLDFESIGSNFKGMARVQVKDKVPAVALNASCPCGSGKQYKRCHGKVE